ncbi:MAG: glycosyltransferase family 1 protein [Micrococcales bacterium]|nr:glycosyltransferase family 1 protein [Micrococcales bacterium]
MRVLHIIARFNVGGTAAWIHELTKNLSGVGIESLVATGEVGKSEFESQLLQELNYTHMKGLGNSVNPLQDLKAFWEIRNLIKSYNPDVVNTHTAKAGLLGRLANFSLGEGRKPLAHTLHGHLLYGYFPKPIVRLVVIIEKVLSSFTDLIIFAGEKVQLDCLNVGIGKLDQSVVMYPGVSEVKLSKESARRTESDRLRVGWLGRVTKIKRPDRVLEIAGKLPNLDFYVGGEGDLLKTCKESAPNNVSFLGWSNPHEFWREMDICLLTSDNEALPISIIEAQLNGLPTVATDVGSTSEVVIDGESGYLTSVDIDEMVEKLTTLSENSNLREEMGKKAKARAREVFSPQRQRDDHIAAYKMAIKSFEQRP